MTAALITGPALEPVSLADVKAHLRVDASDEDALLTAAIVSARVHVESATRRVLIEQGWRIYYDAWPRRRIVRLPVAP
ncbi:MAG: head-tail connector protein, partial [Nisaea sp.]